VPRIVPTLCRPRAFHVFEYAVKGIEIEDIEARVTELEKAEEQQRDRKY